MSLRNWLQTTIAPWLARRSHALPTGIQHRGPATHVVILDGTMSSLKPGRQTHTGQLYQLLCEVRDEANLTIHYEPGIQWRNWSDTLDVIQGRGINRQIERAYGALASRYRAGDQVILAGYSRGAYAVRSLAGMVDLVGLLLAEHATQRAVRQAYRHYRQGATSDHASVFRRAFCHPHVDIEAVAVWDTVKALGLRLPVIWRWSHVKHAFHNHTLGRCVKHGFHALALNETRRAYTPVLWKTSPQWPGRIEQVWFAGTHGDVGGQIHGVEAARPLANISLVWMLERLESCGLAMPAGWAGRFPTDSTAPSMGKWRGWSKLFLLRGARDVGRDPSETLHETVAETGALPPPLAVSN